MPVVVLDISSDEEQGSEEGPKSSGDLDWIKHLLGISSGEDSYDSDDVIFISEKKPEPKPKSSKTTLKDINDDDDDDCVVLDGDPENGVTSVDDEANGSDELLVVGEKGPIACRDYPHARHLCAKFPFSSTPHETHCNQCHCYVCDSLAPCLQWGTGISSSDHCHANDKTEMWKIQRTNLKVGKSSPSPASINYGTSHNTFLLQCNEIPRLNNTSMFSNSMSRNQVSRSNVMRTISSSSNSMPQNHASRPTRTFSLSPQLNSGVPNQVSGPNNIPVRSTATSSTNHNGAYRGRYQELQSTAVRNRYRRHSLPRQVLGVRSHGIQREQGRGSGATSLGPPFLHSHIISDGVGSAGDTPTVNHSAHGSSGFSSHVNPAEQSDRNLNGLNGVWLPKNMPSYTSPSSELVSGSHINQQHTVASDIQVYRQPLSQSNDGGDFYQSCIQDNDAPSSYVACLNSNMHENEHQIGRQSENASGNSTQCGIASQETYQPKPQLQVWSPTETAGNVWSPTETAGNVWSPIETAGNPDFTTAFDSSWTENTSQITGPLLESVNQPSHVKVSTTLTTATDSIELQIQGSHVEPQNQGSHLHNTLFDFENWLSEKDSNPTVADDVVPSELNIHSPDFVPDDEGTCLYPWW